MVLTLFLAKVFGVYLLIAGAALLVRRGYFIPVLGGFVEERTLRMVVGFAELLGGLFLVMSHIIWAPLPALIITFIGIAATFEGFLYLILPDDIVKKYLLTLNVPAWYIWGGLISIVLGGYLSWFGFGL
ncbi:hypothetical protein KKH15_02225 [Patescibacteria group bacterium]|nr:hypothetical protein [Patescibacteria group bacterium]MBU1754867.1 hypothetical protein [Patescibacteria group bacterium]